MVGKELGMGHPPPPGKSLGGGYWDLGRGATQNVTTALLSGRWLCGWHGELLAGDLVGTSRR